MTNYNRSRPPKQNDELLKGAFEENFSDFLHFLYPNADDIFDLSKDIEFMDKELFAIIPDRERKKGKRIADLLAKVFLKDGSEKWILIHTEIEGGNQEDFAFRLFQYWYRLLDRYGVPVETVVVFTGNKSQRRPSEYRHKTIDTQILFQYRAYHVFDNTDSELLAMKNAFALIVLACQKALSEGKIPEEELGSDRLTIAKTLIQHFIDKDRITNFLIFLKNFLYIKDDEINRIFDEEIIQLTGGTIDMSVLEIVKKQERQQGIQQGIQKGRLEERAKAVAEKKEFAIKMLQGGFDVEQISDILGLPIKEIEKLK